MTYVNAKYIYGGHAISSGRVLADLREGKLAAEWVGGQWRIDKDVADVYVAKVYAEQASRSSDALYTRNVKILKAIEVGGQSLAQIGRDFGLSRSQIAMIRNRARRRLSHPALIGKYGKMSELPAINPCVARSDEEVSSYLEKHIDDIEFSVRTHHALINANIDLISELVQKTEAELLRIPNLGRKSLNEIKEVLNYMGLRLGYSS